MSDISGRTAFGIVLLGLCSMSWVNPDYLSSPTGYADGGDMYSHIAEALHLKELIQNRTSNFWYDKATLGYPMFTAYHPLPCFLTALNMLLLERFLSPLLAFRLLFTVVLSLTPLSWFVSGQFFGLSRLQSTCLAMLTFSMQSWRKFGLEMDAFQEYGLYTQAYGFLLLPVTVSSIFNEICKTSREKHSILPTLLLSTTFLSHFFFGLYACILSGVLFVTYVIIYVTSHKIRELKHVFAKLFYIHINALALISWWIIGCLVSYQYVGGLPWRNESEDGYPLKLIAEKFWHGDVFDMGRTLPWFTILVAVGFIFLLGSIIYERIKAESQFLHQVFGIWIIGSCLITIILFLGRTTFGVLYNLIPFHTEMECIKYLSGIHFCGLLIASYGLSELILWFTKIMGTCIRVFLSCLVISERNISNTSLILLKMLAKIGVLIKVTLDFISTNIFRLLRGLLLSFVVFLLLSNQFKTMGAKLTMHEANHELQSQLMNLKREPREGRMLTHSSLGTAGPWDLAFLPRLTEKPILMTYSRGYHDSLSVYYLEHISFDPTRAEQFKALMRLYNVHYLMSSGIDLDETFMKECQIENIKRIHDLDFHTMLSEMNDYGYFDFVNIPGYIEGDLKAMRETVLQTLDMYTANRLLLINPKNFEHNDRNYVSISVKKKPFLENVLQGNRKGDVYVTWQLNEKEMESREVIDGIIKDSAHKWMYSQVIEERSYKTEYRAVVQVAEKNNESKDDDYLLFKVTYHPFWKSYYFPVEDDFTLDQFSPKLYPKGKRYTKVHHVTPNLMAVSLPPGRYCVVFTYRFPGILKILAMLCVAACCYMITGTFRKDYSIVLEDLNSNGVGNTWRLSGRYRAYSIIAKERFDKKTDLSVRKRPRSRTVPAMRKCSFSGSVKADALDDWMNQIEKRNGLHL